VKSLIVERPNNGRRLIHRDERTRKIYKHYNFYIDTWNVLSLYKAGMLKQFAARFQKYRIVIVAVPIDKMNGKWSTGNRELRIDTWW
jgi:hypothetical protein